MKVDREWARFRMGWKEILPMGDFEILASVPEVVETALKAGLSAHSRAHNVQPYVASPLSLVKRDAAGRIVAGLTGKTFWNWLYIDLLWVDEALRGQGIGRALVQAAEQEALQRGCHSSYLWTESHQGPDFYPRLGYKEFVSMPDFPVGFERKGFMKRIAA